MDYHQDRFEDYSLLIFKRDILIGVLPANKVGDSVYSHQGLTYGGLVLSEIVKFEDVLEGFKALLKYLKLHGKTRLQLKMTPKIYHLVPSDEIDYLLFKIRAELYRRDLTSTIDIFNKLKLKSSNRIRGLKRAVKHNLIIKETNDFQAFWTKILVPNLERKHNVLPVHSLDEIIHLKQKFPEQIKQFNVYKNNQIVAGVTIFETQNVAHAQYISANHQKQELGSLDLIFDYLINQIYKEKHFFDFGISNENQGESVNNGLLSWKESFGARSVVHEFYKINTNNYQLLDDVLL